MKRCYEPPVLEIEKFTEKPSVFTASTGWGEGEESGEF